ncbi:MAG: ATP-grasp domain-containing protein [Bacteroidales bacterium]|nr:ATP-grasp domain-containing protein [Bacteroidales bacterium]MDD3961929.1 ATP-grasp domain-containing protein [Bacteroidales bacterium]MDY0286633.1 ATP-grasp domain-containing protein [Bacteroidales bacterium]
MRSEKKKLLLLGTNMGTVDIINYAHSKRIHVIVTDNLPIEKSKGKQLADECWMISTTDIKTLEIQSKESKIDGIFAGISETNIQAALTLSKKLSLPFYTSQYQWDAFTNKKKFKDLCNEFNIPTIIELQDIPDSFESFPIIVKPVDGSGGFGISICYNYDDYLTAKKRAIEASKTKNVIIEPYITSKEITVFYVIENGVIKLYGMSDRFTKHHTSSRIPLPVGHIFPSIYLNDYCKNIDNNVRKMLNSLGLKTGIVFIQGFSNKGRIQFYEMGYRLTGTQEYHILEEETGYNPMKMMVDYALSLNSYKKDIFNRITPEYNSTYFLLNILVRPGKIKKIDGLEKIFEIPEVLNIINELDEGDVIKYEHLGTLKQIATRIYLKLHNRSKIQEILDKININLSIMDVSGNNLILDMIKEENLKL